MHDDDLTVDRPTLISWRRDVRRQRAVRQEGRPGPVSECLELAFRKKRV